MADGDTTVVGADSHFKGELSFESTARINGKFDGQITGKGELHVNQNALCKADVHAGGVQVDGRVEGNLQAKDTVRLNANGAVKGDITAAKMVMAEGAAFYGMCAVGPDAQQQAAKSGGGQPPQSGQGGQPPKK
ncbi:MAG: polymer-forming cytoskeletal protein [Planctomycetota bacterium]